jgi:ADP-heptose:LPS heptosyltransferase
MFNTPILFLIFNRPLETQEAFNKIKEIQPKQLFVAADGARTGNYNDLINCVLTKDIIKQVDWDCEVKTLYREQNLGCGKAVSEAITWFFNEVEQGIILEDDCVPNHSFFLYCEELLEKYKDNDKIYNIGGVNFQDGKLRGDASYYFSAVPHIWGWATWRRAWRHYDFDMIDYPEFVTQKKITNYFDDEKLKSLWLKKFELVYQKKIDTWDYQWMYTVYNQGGISIIPNQNLVTNIGFGENATHTTDIGKYTNLKTVELKTPFVHPTTIELNKEADYYYYYTFDQFDVAFKKENSKLTTVKHKILMYVEYYLKKIYLNKKNGATNNVLIIKADSIGDYIIARNSFKCYIEHASNRHKQFYLMVNSKLKNFIPNSDKDLYKEIIYLENSVFRKFTSVMKFYIRLKKMKFNTVINSVYSRTTDIDSLVNSIGAVNIIGHLGDCSNQLTTEKIINDTHYTTLIDITAQEKNTTYTHEFYKNNYFFEAILKDTINNTKPHIDIDYTQIANKNKLILFPGAQSSFRMWDTVKYAQLIDKLCNYNPNFEFHICTASYQTDLFNEIKAHTSQKLFSHVDLTIEPLLQLMANAQLIIGSDSAPAHLAASIQKNYVCLSNANHINRFVPYPVAMKIPLYVVYPDVLSQLLEKDKEAVAFFNKESKIELKSISVETVYNKILDIINH